MLLAFRLSLFAFDYFSFLETIIQFQQRPSEIKWDKPNCIGDLPCKRSGHTFTNVESFAYLFGGCVAGGVIKGPDGDTKKSFPGPTNDLYKLDMSSDSDLYWTKLKTNDRMLQQPSPRWQHTATKFDETKVAIFGGFTASKDQPRLNDVWVLDTEDDSWSQVTVDTTPKISDESSVTPSWVKKGKSCSSPCPRGSHSASLVDNCIVIFGGYGGMGYMRNDFCDLYALCTKTWQWFEIETVGTPPKPRSGHKSVAVDGKLYVMGGWNAAEQFDDVHILDFESLTWTLAESACGPEKWGPKRWNFTALATFAVPHWKVFIFGGNSGDLDQSRPQGRYRNDIQVLECSSVDEDNNRILEWNRPAVSGDQPSPRSDTEMFYEPNFGKLFLFGGWSNRWHGEVFSCEISSVVGPPYNIFDIKSREWLQSIGPVTGGSDMILRGKGFTSVVGVATVRFACQKGFLDVTGEVLDDESVSIRTPNFDKYGAIKVQLRLKIGSQSFTNNTVDFSFFSVTDSTQTVAFGPGILSQNPINRQTFFLIQAKDKTGNIRVCGMDKFHIDIHCETTCDKEDSAVPYQIEDQNDGTYLIQYTPKLQGEYRLNVKFLGTFGGQGGDIRGSTFVARAVDSCSEISNDLDGKVAQEYVSNTIANLKSFVSSTSKGIGIKVSKDDSNALISVKEHLRSFINKTELYENSISATQAYLCYLKRKGMKKFPNLEKTLKGLEGGRESWNKLKSMIPAATERISSVDRIWTEKTKFKIEAYSKELEVKQEEFRKLEFWLYFGKNGNRMSEETISKSITNADAGLKSETRILEENAYLCDIFELGDLIVPSRNIIEGMKLEIEMMTKLWKVNEDLEQHIESVEGLKWTDLDLESLEDGGKAQLKAVKSSNKCTKDSEAFKCIDKRCKDFLVSIPLIGLLRSKAMRDRHWNNLIETTGKKDFNPPTKNEAMLLGEVLSLNLYSISNEVEEICDQAVKEEKIEETLAQMEKRWSNVVFVMTPYKKLGSDEEIPLLGIGEEDFESLENDQLVVQGMLASRFVAQFQTEVSRWQTALFNVNEVFLLISEIQRTWSYLEPLFIHSEEVKRELPEDTTRFASIDKNVQVTLKTAWKTQNVKDAFNVEGMLEQLEFIQEQLDLCKKSLADFLDGRRRQFPRYYFVSEADLLDILSNGSDPNKILVHIPKVYLSTKTLVFSEELSDSGRPIATEFIAGVGSEVCTFEPPVPLEGKVEIYMQTVLNAQKLSIFETVKRSLHRYQLSPRSEWVLAKNKESGRPLDPAQTTLLVLAINYVQEVEEVFDEIENGDKDAMRKYSEKQVKQLSDLIQLTQSDLSKGDRTRIMVCITMDAHSRDIVEKMVRNKVNTVDSFMWQSQLKHKYRHPLSHSRYQDRDPELRGPEGERAEIAICDAILPYDYEYLGNGPRLVITPLTDRVYVTATQALNLNMGCAPAGPAGTGKTETTKDLANALAKLIYVINCSPEMDYKGLGNIFKGVASSGAWVCFDEFNRLIPEVLSVCTVQFKAVCDGISAGAVRVTVEGDEISLDPTCGAFITMNPGYLGRSELPEGLKALFRPMTVMVPDLILICENMLMAEGFVTAKALASKFFCLYALLKALLSAQLHYDWGLRAIKSVLVVAGGFKRAEPQLAEDALLMRALRDFNIPKIVREDEVVFFGLLGDLFPGLDPPRKRDEELETHVVDACKKLGNDPDETFCLKVVQLEELLAIRHCVFVMGPAGSGKSQCWRTLKEARDLQNPTMITKVVDLNPKAVKTEELYGYISLSTREWRDGLLSNIMRSLSGIPDEKPKWILLDGDLDANWIESMNSVMDDNRMLTLASNERIPLLPHMRMIFEIRDLKHATPATVSRAGILYISTDDGTQWRSLIRSWLSKSQFSQDIVSIFESLFENYVAPSLLWILINTKSIVPVEDMNRVQVLLNMLDGCLNGKDISSPKDIETIFVYCAVWAFGSSLCVSDDGVDNRKLFSDWWRSEFTDVKFPSRDTVFDYWLDPETTKFESWTKSSFFYSVDYDSSKTAMTQVTVPTPETCSVAYWMDLLVKMRKPIMLAGPAGTGKTQLVQGMLANLDPALYQSSNINFNFYTTSAVLSNTMAIPLEKKTGSNYGPPGTSKLIYFIDDLNLPEVDTYNTQSAIAHLRQHMEYEHCYELQKMTLKNIANSQVISCMNPTAGCFFINPRLQRWFTTFAIGLPGSTSLLTIYQTFLDGHLSNFSEDIQGLSNSLIKAALGLHAAVSTSFRKTAANFHYEFNIRHISNVFQGLLVSQPQQFSNPEKLILLWLHESERVYGDRLVNATDVSKYNSLAQGQCKKIFPSFPIAKFYAKENAEPLLFCNFVESIEDPVYDQVTCLHSMSDVLEDALREYNETNATMDLVLFEDAMKHVARIVRIVRNESGHALLVGVGGSGKQSLSRLAAFICGYSLMQIVISSTYSVNDLKDDLKAMYNKAGVKGEGVMFLLTDSQITNERFLVFINDLLASGNIPDLFAPDEVDSICNALTSKVKAAGIVPEKKNCWDYFLGEIRRNLHVCLCFSPVGDDFRNRAMKFPALVNCTVIDIFQPWPRDALYSVGKKFLSDVDLGSNDERDVITSFLPFSFEAVNKATIDFKSKERRFVYTTPKSYLELIKLYRTLLFDKRKDASAAIDRLDNGLSKLKETSESVAKLEETLKVMLEDAATKKETAEGIAEVVAKEKASVEEETAKAQIEKEEVARIAKEVGIKQKDTEEDLAKAEPAVEAAMQALDTLDQKDLSSCKGMLKPPPKLDEVFAATMCLLAGIMPSIVITKSGKVKDTSWDAAKKQLMSNIKEYMMYLKDIKRHVDENTINHNNFKEVRQYIEQDYFNVETMKTKNQAAAGLCSFVLNIVQYYDIVVTVEPKRKALEEANAQLLDANTKLEKVMKHVADLEEKLAKLTTDLNKANASKKEAMDAVDKGERKLNLAQRLTTALSSENERWGENVQVLRKDEELLVGDVLVASAFISYIGPFTKPFRTHLMDKVFKPFLWSEFNKISGEEGRIPMSPDPDPLKILTSEAEVAQWNADCLPADVVSTENGSIVASTSRWPLIIDPQLQGIRWLKNKEGGKERNLQVVRLGQKDLIMKLESALENGHTLIIENIGETLEAVLNPVIQRATIKRGSRYFIKVGDKECDFHPDFRLYLHTKLSNPHYPPEIQAETTLINFTVTMSGLEDQLLNLVVEKERPDLAELSEELIKKQNGFTIRMKQLEDNILHKLATAEGDITEDVALIEGLEETKRVSDDIEQQSKLAKQTQADILGTSEKYRSVANRSSLLFFLMNDLVKIHTYYIYSLEAFQDVFFRGIDAVSIKDSVSENDGESEEDINTEDLSLRCEELRESITKTVFNYIRRGLFEKDKLTVAALMTFKVLINDGKMDPVDVDFLLKSKSCIDPGNMGPLQEWLPESIWPRIKALEDMTRFKGLGDNMQSDSDEWNSWFDSEKAEISTLPGEYQKSLTQFDRMILLRAMRPDRLLISLSDFISDMMGKEYVVQKPFSMGATFEETNNKTPVFFVLFAGVDPTPWVEKLGKDRGVSLENKRFVNISMGQGQEAPAEAVVKQFSKEGGWVMLQNCHLMSSWVPKLERLLEVVSQNAHADFRCFISAEPPPLASWTNMPESLMQSCIKVANEAPADIQSNLIRSWDNFSQESIGNCTKPREMKACLFSLCWFHAVVCGRRRFGQQGWSRKYSFNTGDLIICSNVLRSYLDANEDVPWDDLRYIFGEIMYGGHITDAWDRRTCNTYLKVYQNKELFNDLELAPGFKSPAPDSFEYNDYISYVENSMPPESPPLFGLHPNTEIGYLTNSAESLLFNVLTMSGGDNSDGSKNSTGDAARDTMTNLQERLPEQFEMITLTLKAKPLLEGPSGPYIVVALQECGRMNVLLKEIEKSLSDLDKGLKGQLNMSQEMEDLLTALKINQWPGRNPFSKCSWEKLAWPSQKNLMSQFLNMIQRVEQLTKWVETLDVPKSIWLPGLFNPSSYLTAAQQVTARKTGLALDKMTIETHITSMWDASEVTDYAVDGTFIHGLFIEGARWPKGDDAGETFVIEGTRCSGSLSESRLKELMPPMPVSITFFSKAVLHLYISVTNFNTTFCLFYIETKRSFM